MTPPRLSNTLILAMLTLGSCGEPTDNASQSAAPPQTQAPKPALQDNEPAATPSTTEPTPVKPPKVVAGQTLTNEQIAAHYAVMTCLKQNGAPEAALAAAYEKSGISEAQWRDGLGRILDALSEDPNGALGRALTAAEARPCPEVAR